MLVQLKECTKTLKCSFPTDGILLKTTYIIKNYGYEDISQIINNS